MRERESLLALCIYSLPGKSFPAHPRNSVACIKCHTLFIKDCFYFFFLPVFYIKSFAEQKPVGLKLFGEKPDS